MAYSTTSVAGSHIAMICELPGDNTPVVFLLPSGGITDPMWGLDGARVFPFPCALTVFFRTFHPNRVGFRMAWSPIQWLDRVRFGSHQRAISLPLVITLINDKLLIESIIVRMLSLSYYQFRGFLDEAGVSPFPCALLLVFSNFRPFYVLVFFRSIWSSWFFRIA